MIRSLNSRDFQNISMPFVLIVFALLFLFAILSACQTTSKTHDIETKVETPAAKIQFVPARISDFDLEWQIRGFQDLNPTALDELRATSQKGVITVTGQYKDPWMKRLFIKSIQRIPGVKSIRDETALSAPAQINQQAETTSASINAFDWNKYRLPVILLALFTFAVLFLRQKRTSQLKPLR